MTLRSTLPRRAEFMGFRPLIWLWGAQTAGIASGVVFASVTARTLLPADFVLLGLWQVVFGYGTVLAEFGTAHVGPRRLAGADPEIPMERLPGAVFRLRAGGALLGALATSGWFFFVAPRGVNWWWFLLLILIPLATAASAEWWQLGCHREHQVAKGRLARHAVIVGGALLLWWEPKPWAAAAAYAVGVLAQTGVSWRGLPTPLARATMDELRSLVRECWPLALALLAQQWVWSGALVTAADRYSASDFGAILIGFRCYSVGLAMLAGYASYLLPRSAAAKAEGGAAFTRWMQLAYRRAGMATLALVVGAPLAGWLVVPLVFGDRYPAGPLFAMLYLLALIPVVWRITSSNTLVALGRTRAYCAASLPAALCCVLLTFALPKELRFAPVLVAAFGEAIFGFVSHQILRRVLSTA